jgi:LysR family transcriptional regulator (chromosome initiation inhibitor)
MGHRDHRHRNKQEMLENRKTEALLAVIETGSFDLAASKLNITASAISQRIRSLEAFLGVPLVIRTRPCRSTQEGLKLVQYLRRTKILANEFEAEFSRNPDSAIRIAIAVNNDSLGTWLLPALAEFIIRENILVDIRVNDQTFTHRALEEGTVIAAVSSRDIAMRGCVATRLGAVRYRLLASRQFITRWFLNGISRETISKAPLLVFDDKDTLQSDFISIHFNVRQESCRCHFIPSTEAFLSAINLGIGYGMVPELHYKDALTAGNLVDVSPGNYTDIPLYWHHWGVQSPKVEILTTCLIKEAKTLLL